MMNSQPWTAWFAIYPVEVDAYRDDEIKNGKFSYTVFMRWVERRPFTIDDVDDDSGIDREEYIKGRWKYRLLP
jgi:hypothetical protein